MSNIFIEKIGCWLNIMDLLTPPVSILNAQFRTFEELCEAPLAWDVEFIQTEPGLIDLSAVFGISSRFQFGHC